MFPGIRSQYSAQQCLELLMSLPPLKRLIIERVWDCAEVHYRTLYAPEIKLVHLNSLLRRKYADEPRSISAYSRAHRDYPMLLWWPILRGQRRPWEGAVMPEDAPVERTENDSVLPRGEQILAGQLRFRDGVFYMDDMPVELWGEDGIVRVRSLVNLIAASIATAIMVDDLDGKLDGALRFCHMLHSLAPLVTR